MKPAIHGIYHVGDEQPVMIAKTPAPLTRDFVRLGRVPHWGDTRRAREELVPELIYPTLDAGLSTLR